MGSKLVILFVVLGASMLAGYICRKFRLLPEIVANWLMTGVAVVGYPIVGFISIWGTPLHVTNLWLPILGTMQMGILCWVGWIISKRLTDDPGEQGIFTMASSFGNNGLTMGGFVIYLLLGEVALGLSNIYSLLHSYMGVLLLFPMANHYTRLQSGGTSLGRLLVRSIFDWRSINLPVSVIAIYLSVANVPRPAALGDSRLMDTMMYAINFSTYFAIGLRLSLSSVPKLKKLIAGLVVTRFGLGLAIGLGLWAITLLTPWPLDSAVHVGDHMARNVFLICSFVSTGVTVVMVANMFSLHPRQSSALFITNSVIYIAIVVPIIMWVFGTYLR